jgi:hypothetical protein
MREFNNNNESGIPVVLHRRQDLAQASLLRDKVLVLHTAGHDTHENPDAVELDVLHVRSKWENPKKSKINKNKIK